MRILDRLQRGGRCAARSAVQWDENFEFAQAMTGAVPYDDGHPLRQYTLSAYNFQFYSSALLLLLNDNPVFVCGIRNVLFVIATVLPVSMLGTWTSGRNWVGHAAALLILMGLHLEFDGVYPQFVWPGMFSNGHVGTGYALLSVGVLASGHVRCAGLLLGLMPMIHLGQMPAAGLLACVYAGWCVAQKDWTAVKRAGGWFSIGLIACGVFYGIQLQFVLPSVLEGAYFANGNADTIWQGRMTQGRDMHRSLPTGNIHIITVGTLLVGLGGWRLLRERGSALAKVWGWVTVYSLCVVAVTYSIALIHFSISNWGMLNGEIPYLLLGWLPYRLLNHLAPLLLVMCVALLVQCSEMRDAKPGLQVWIIPALFLAALLEPFLEHAIGQSLYERYFLNNDGLFFLLAGCALGLLISERSGRTRVLYGAGLLIAVAPLAWVHQFGAAILVTGIAVTFLLSIRDWNFRGEFVRVATYGLSALLLIGILWTQVENRGHLPIGDFEAGLIRVLEEAGDPNAMLVARPDQVLLQAQTGHPVFADMATEYHGSYRPSLGPSIQKMYGDVYGIWFEDRQTTPVSWQSLWGERGAAEWRVLGET